VKILGVEKFGTTIFKPFRAGERLAFRTVAIRAGVVSVALMTALVATLEMTAENGGPADLDRMHHAALRDGHRSAVLLTIVGAVAAEHIRHFELWAIHRPAAQKC
jgi:hypothetical protein